MNVFDKARGEQAPEEGQEADLEEKDPAYLQAMELMLSKLYEEGAAQGIAQALQSAPDPVQGIVEQTMNMVEVLEDATQGSVPDELVMLVVMNIIEEIVGIAQASGMQVGGREIAEVVREVLAQVVENLGGDSSAIREEMGAIDPNEVGAQLDQMEG